METDAAVENIQIKHVIIELPLILKLHTTINI